jgi:ABC-2 type transport system ATP-binding protein
LDDVSLEVEPGHIVGFVGANGAGKTTTIHCILNIFRRDSGSIKLFGQEMRDQDTALRERIAFISERSPFYERLTPRRLSKILGRVYKGWDRSQFQHYLEVFRLADGQPLKDFSTGMSAKLSLAVALSHQAELLILDEATSGLDPLVREEVLTVFRQFVADGAHAVLLSTHIVSDLDKVADEIVFIHDGRVLLSAERTAIQARFGSVDAALPQLIRGARA